MGSGKRKKWARYAAWFGVALFAVDFLFDALSGQFDISALIIVMVLVALLYLPFGRIFRKRSSPDAIRTAGGSPGLSADDLGYLLRETAFDVCGPEDLRAVHHDGERRKDEGLDYRDADVLNPLSDAYVHRKVVRLPGDQYRERPVRIDQSAEDSRLLRLNDVADGSLHRLGLVAVRLELLLNSLG
jgi:hypothetical protein